MTAPVLLWLRRDLRLADHPALMAAREEGPVIPVFVLDPETEALGAAAKWRLGLSLADLRQRLEARGSRLVLRHGAADAVLLDLARAVGARAVHWSRLYAPAWVARDAAVEAALGAAGIAVRTHAGTLLHEPWALATRNGDPFKVFTPFARAALQGGVGETLGEPRRIDGPQDWPEGDRLEDWALGAAMDRGATVVGRHVVVGETAARDRLDGFLADAVGDYATGRDRPDRDGTSGLSENLAYGEISVRSLWHAAERAGDGRGVETFRRELLWREFAAAVLWHCPELAEVPWRASWGDFPWRRDNADAERWRRGMTGEPMVDAGMRELFVTGRMHNRVRMLVASYLTKHLMTDWRVGLAWFAECLIDWEPASNAMNWQWVAGSGPDAAPYFRVFSPARQAERFDPDGAYRRRFVAGYEGSGEPEARAFFDAVPRAWNLDPDAPPPEPVVAPGEGRKRALAAYAAWNGQG